MTKQLQQNLIALAIFFVALCFVYYKYLVTPLKLKFNDSLQQRQQTEERLNEMKRRAMELPKLQAEMKLLEEEVSSLEKLLPKDKEIPNLLRIVTKTAQRYQLKIVNFSPVGMSAQANYNEVPFQMTVQGTYHGLAHFLSELGQESRILSARDIVLSTGQQTAQKGGDPVTINASFTLVAYTFKG